MFQRCCPALGQMELGEDSFLRCVCVCVCVCVLCCLCVCVCCVCVCVCVCVLCVCESVGRWVHMCIHMCVHGLLVCLNFLLFSAHTSPQHCVYNTTNL